MSGLRLPGRRGIIVAALGIAMALALGYRLQERLREPAPAETRPLLVEAVELAARPFGVYVESVGTVAAEHRIMVSARLSASVLQVPNREGAQVRKGDLLVLLDHEEVQRERQRQDALVKRAQSELAYWRNERDVDRDLFEKGMLERRRMDDSRRRVATLEAALQEAEATLELARLRESWTRVTAPFPGFVQSNVVLAGEQVAPGSPLVELVAAAPLKVIVPVAERDLERLAAGQAATIYLPATDQTVESRIHRIYPALDSRSRNATVELRLPGDSAALRPGMAAEVRLLTSRDPEALVVPQHALQLRDGRNGLFVIESGRALWREVEPGAAQNGEVALRTGVNAGDRVIVTPHPGLADGRPVETDTTRQRAKSLAATGAQ